MPRSNKSTKVLGNAPAVTHGEEPSKTALKKQAQALQQLGLELTKLPREYRRRAAMDEDLSEAIEQYLTIRSHEARRRQMQLIGKLLRGVDPQPLQAVVDAFAAGRAVDAERLHAVERWRDELIADDEAVTRWMSAHPSTDAQRLRTLIRNARREVTGVESEQRKPRSYRDLFQLIRQTLDRPGQE